jgi:putative transposase
MPRTRSEREREEWRREVALFRYTLVREPADPDLSKAERGRLVRDLVAREHVGPDGRPTRVARTTLDDWIRAYRRGGYMRRWSRSPSG